MHFTNVGDNVWVGDFKSCNAYLKDFPLSIHIWRESNRGENRLCQRVFGGEPGEGLSVKWREGEPLSALSLPFETIMQYASRPGRLLIHCAGGVCRSTTLAVASKIVRGRRPADAVKDVYEALWSNHKYCPFFPDKVMQEIFTWAG